MLLPFEVYNSIWKDQFEIIKQGLNEILSDLRVSIEHIGSTSVEGLSAKPIIDIMVGMNRESDLDEVPPLLMDKGYIYYEMYNITMPYRRFFVLLTNSLLNSRLSSQIRQDNEISELLQDHTLRKAHYPRITAKFTTLAAAHCISRLSSDLSYRMRTIPTPQIQTNEAALER